MVGSVQLSIRVSLRQHDETRESSLRRWGFREERRNLDARMTGDQEIGGRARREGALAGGGTPAVTRMAVGEHE